MVFESGRNGTVLVVTDAYLVLGLGPMCSILVGVIKQSILFQCFWDWELALWDWDPGYFFFVFSFKI